MRLLGYLIINGLAVVITSYILPGVRTVGVLTALIVAVVLGAVNTFIRPLLIVLTLPINVLTLGLFTLVINALLVLLVSSLVPGFTVESFWWALLFSIVLTIISTFLDSLAQR